ncbi:uncharacterized protein LOC113342254 [Papaver somniferum]|uniref:uncharacterized protein LOC113342254 n=1 Tax=Papaver somniferum TaxID=3469 RepID=UPI000E702F29|nr:uncharacterized protein LOC113342254 [Papaver somniferum]
MYENWITGVYSSGEIETMATKSVAHGDAQTLTDLKEVGWTKPQHNQSKINFDASWSDNFSLAGYGMILRDETGEVVQAKAGSIRASTAEDSEALSLLETACWAKSMELSNFWVEGDCERLILFAQNKVSNIFWRNQAIVSEAVRILQTCNNFLGFAFKNRKCNEVADALAKEARKKGIHKQVWLHMPVFISSFLLFDVLFPIQFRTVIL